MERQARIEAYVSGKLVGEDLVAFDQELAVDAELRADVEVERVLQGTAIRAPELRFRDLVSRVSADQETGAGTGGASALKPSPVINIRRNWTWMAAAASILLVLSVGVIQYLRAPEPETLALAYAERTTTSVRGDDHGAILALQQAFADARTALLEKRPADALNILGEQHPVTSCDVARKQWLSALALLMGPRLKEAERELERVTSSGCQDKDAARELLEEL